MTCHPLRAKIEAATWWRDHLRRRRLVNAVINPDRLLIATIQSAVAGYFLISVDDMNSPRTTAAIARPRMIAMYLARHLTRQSLPDIGRRFGGRDHSTVIHALRRVEVWRSMDPEVGRAIAMLSARLGEERL